MKPPTFPALFLLLAILATLWNSGTWAEAQTPPTLPDATFELETYTTTNNDNQFFYGPGSITSRYTLGSSLGESGSALLQSGSSPLLKASASVFGSSPSPSGSSALVEETFYFEITGPTGQSIPIVYAARGRTSAIYTSSGGGGATASLTTYAVAGQHTLWSGFVIGGSSGDSSAYPGSNFSLNRTVLVPFNTPITVILNTTAGTGDIDSTSSAAIEDVQISIDPAYARTHPGDMITFSASAVL